MAPLSPSTNSETEPPRDQVSPTEAPKVKPSSTPHENDPAQTPEPVNQYPSLPLSEPGNIRLLRLMPHGNKEVGIQCQLLEYHLDEGPHVYEALSYAWDSKDNPKPIYIQSDDKSDNSAYYVRANLYAALLHLRNHTTDRIIWVDAICINQEDDVEKGQQVQSMAKIFAKARGVIVWLGEAADHSDEALEVIRKAAEGQDTNSPDTASQQVVLTLPDQQATNSTIHEAIQDPISQMLGRLWFQRFWVGGGQSMVYTEVNIIDSGPSRDCRSSTHSDQMRLYRARWICLLLGPKQIDTILRNTPKPKASNPFGTLPHTWRNLPA